MLRIVLLGVTELLTPAGRLPLKILVALEAVYTMGVIAVPEFTVWLLLPLESVTEGTAFTTTVKVFDGAPAQSALAAMRTYV
jgi:hypothetical protein